MKKGYLKTLFASMCVVAALSFGGCGKDSSTEKTTSVKEATTEAKKDTDKDKKEDKKSTKESENTKESKDTQQETTAAEQTTEAAATEQTSGNDDVYAYISYADAYANVKSVAGSGSNVLSYYKGFDPAGHECWVFSVSLISASDEEVIETYYVDNHQCYSQSSYEEGKEEVTPNEDTYAGITYDEAVSLVKEREGSGAEILSVIQGTSPDGVSAWIITVMPISSSEDCQSVTYYAGEFFCYPEE